jgi:16S rRNA (cytosine967-C5)-methyltransferase
VLRAVIREKDNIKLPNASENIVDYLNVVYSMPTWIVEQLIVQYGMEEASRIIKAMSNYDDSICVRANTSKEALADIIKLLEEDGIEVSKSDIYENCLYLKNVDYLENTQAFNEGLISVQDLSSMLVAVIANPKKDDVCLDLCAAPGGKALHLWELMNGSGKVIARDISDYKVGLIEENIDRTEALGVKAEVYDATILDKDMIEKADIVIADLPCSGLGIIGKKSDIKYNITKESQKELVKLQRDILANAWQYVKVGGTLIYSTCTLNKEENMENAKFIEDNYPMKRVDISSYVPQDFCGGTAKDGYIQMLPGINGTDGFFISRFERY